MMSQTNIHELVARCQQNDEQAQFALYNMDKAKYKGLCRRYARSDEDAEDIFQEAFVQIFRSLPSLQNVNTLGAWMRQIFVRTAINYYNKHLKNYEYVGDAPLMFESNSDHNLILSELSKEELLKVINKLPDGYRVIFNMYAIDGFAHAEIAQQLGISESTSKSQYSRAKDWLRKRLVEEGVI
jgi:RNA polymerase sigma-70 factor (ECF subfamily)